MDRFLVPGALGSLVGKREGEANPEDPAGRRAEESTRKRPRAETLGNAGPLASPTWRHIRAEGLSCDYTVLFGKAEADKIFQELEQGVEYFTGKQRTTGCMFKTYLIKLVVSLEKSELRSYQ